MKRLILIALLITSSMTIQAQTGGNKRILISTDSAQKINFNKNDGDLDIVVKVEDELDSLSLDIRVEVLSGTFEMFMTDSSGKSGKRLDLEIYPNKSGLVTGVLTETFKFPLRGEWLIECRLKSVKGNIDIKVDMNDK